MGYPLRGGDHGLFSFAGDIKRAANLCSMQPKSFVDIQIPHLSQYDNLLQPNSTCNLTCAAMLLKWAGLKGPNYGYKRLPDNLTAYCEDKGLDRHTLETIDHVLEKFGLKDSSGYFGNFTSLKDHLRKGNPAIVHGYFTKSGHIIVVRGFDEAKGEWICNDPAGNALIGYGQSSGQAVRYPSAWFREKAAPDGNIWLHLVSKK